MLDRTENQHIKNSINFITSVEKDILKILTKLKFEFQFYY